VLKKLEKINLYESLALRFIKSLIKVGNFGKNPFFINEGEDEKIKIIDSISKVLNSSGKQSDLVTIYDFYNFTSKDFEDEFFGFLEPEEYPYVTESKLADQEIIDLLDNNYYLVELDFFGTKIKSVVWEDASPVYYTIKKSDYEKIKGLKFDYEKSKGLKKSGITRNSKNKIIEIPKNKELERPEITGSPKNKEEVKEILDYFNIKKYKINEDLTVDVNGDVNFYDKSLSIIPVKFGIVSGRFNISKNKLTSLENCPKEVGEDFICVNNKLISLEGCPEKVGNIFYCSNNPLTSLKNSLKECSEFICTNNQLTSLEGAPEKISGSFNFSYNQLTSLEGSPEEVTGYFDCSNNQLTSLEGSPEEVTGYFDCSNNQLISLEGSPKKVGGSFECFKNQLTSLEGAPEKVGGNFICTKNQLTSLEGLPKTIGGKVYSDF
jgi:hypothetical protein